MSALFGISIPRFYGTHGFDYDVLITESGAIIWNEYMIAFAIIGSVGTLLWVLLYMYARSVTMKKRADRKDRKESEKKAKKEKKEKKEQSSNNEKEDTIPDSIKESVESDAKVVTKKTTRKKKTTEIKD
jgi:flagellar biosynthesis/type III secretory pathway M-ring protein FliF/YscJ